MKNNGRVSVLRGSTVLTDTVASVSLRADRNGARGKMRLLDPLITTGGDLDTPMVSVGARDPVSGEYIRGERVLRKPRDRRDVTP